MFSSCHIFCKHIIQILKTTDNAEQQIVLYTLKQEWWSVIPATLTKNTGDRAETNCCSHTGSRAGKGGRNAASRRKRSSVVLPVTEDLD